MWDATTASFYVPYSLVIKIVTFDAFYKLFRRFCCFSGVHCYVVESRNFLALCKALCFLMKDKLYWQAYIISFPQISFWIAQWHFSWSYGAKL
jgi:hypothetical protein